MTNKVRRKINNVAYTDGIGYLSPAERRSNKGLNGKPTRLLTKEERRFWAKVNRYCRKTGKPMSMASEMLKEIAA